jgi:hypothetical protein
MAGGLLRDAAREDCRKQTKPESNAKQPLSLFLKREVD